MRKVIIIGSGFSGLSSASFLAKSGWDVTVLEKHHIPGGRARQHVEDNFTFDMGPSWYWMPDVFENFFKKFDTKVSAYYELVRLDPSYKIYWENDSYTIPANYAALRNLFEEIETGAGKKLDLFLEDAAIKYDIGIHKLVQQPGLSFTEFIDMDLLKGIFKLDVFTSIRKSIASSFKNKQLRQLLEFPILFLGSTPQQTPALYSLMNYADMKLGTWYPMGGMYKIVEAMYGIACATGVKFCFAHDVSGFEYTKGKISTVLANNFGVEKKIHADIVIASADYHFVETKLLSKEYRSYSEKYWDSRKMAPSCLLYYVGLNKKLKHITHHMLFFDKDFEKHSNDIYLEPKWPKDPLFYVSATSVTDPTVAPEGKENLFFLVPIAAGLELDTAEKRNDYFQKIVKRFEEKTGEKISEDIIYFKNFGPSDFVYDYNAFKGNAYGLANTLLQTAVLKPSCKSKKLKNLYYTGQLTVPGPGVPPAIISGEVVANQVNKDFGIFLEKENDTNKILKELVL